MRKPYIVYFRQRAFFTLYNVTHGGAEEWTSGYGFQSDSCSSDCDICRLVNKRTTEHIHIPILCYSFPSLKFELEIYEMIKLFYNIWQTFGEMQSWKIFKLKNERSEFAAEF